jgi:predicted transcriptional regulator
MQVDDLMSGPVYTVSPDDTVSHVKNVMLKHKAGRVVVAYQALLSALLPNTTSRRCSSRQRRVGEGDIKIAP